MIFSLSPLTYKSGIQAPDSYEMMETPPSISVTSGGNITEDEAELYDRQIRLWGLDAQRRLRAASVLLIGLKGLGAELAKNIILSGVKSVTLMDPLSIDHEDKMSQFFVSCELQGESRAETMQQNAQLLNPMVQVSSLHEDPKKKEDAFFLHYDVICVTCCPLSLQCRLNKLCFQNNIKFFSGDVFGYYGFSFTDLGRHEYLNEITKKKKVKGGEESSNLADPETVFEKKTTVFTRLEEELSFDWSVGSIEIKKKLRQTPSTFFIVRVFEEFLEQHGRRPSTASLESDVKELQNIRVKMLNKLGLSPKIIPENFYEYGFGELSPVCAIVGGILGQEIIKAVSLKDAPHNNFFFYNGMNDEGMVDKISV